MKNEEKNSQLNLPYLEMLAVYFSNPILGPEGLFGDVSTAKPKGLEDPCDVGDARPSMCKNIFSPLTEFQAKKSAHPRHVLQDHTCEGVCENSETLNSPNKLFPGRA